MPKTITEPRGFAWTNAEITTPVGEKIQGGAVARKGRFTAGPVGAPFHVDYTALARDGQSWAVQTEDGVYLVRHLATPCGCGK